MQPGEWIGVDFDGTLAHYSEGDIWTLGAPIPRMVERVKDWLREGKEVRIVTARVGACGAVSNQAEDSVEFATAQARLVRQWCQEHLGQSLRVTATKDFLMRQLWDDRAVQVIEGTGETVQEYYEAMLARFERITSAARDY